MTEKEIVSINDLPYYKSSSEVQAYVDDPPLRLQSFVAKQWPYIEPTYDALNGVYRFSKCVVYHTYGTLKKLPEYWTDEKKIQTSKAIAITLGGLGGYIFGMRRGGVIKRAFYGGTGLTVLAAFCYPHETMDIGRNSARNLKEAWEVFLMKNKGQWPPHIPPSPKSSLSKSVSDLSKSGNIDDKQIVKK